MKIDEPDLHRGVERFKNAVRRSKWIVNGGQMHAALQIDDGYWNAVSGLRHQQAASGEVGRIVGRTQQARRMRKIVEDLFLVPNMIAGRQDIESQRKKLLGDRRRDAKSAGRVLRVGDGQLDFFGRDDVLQVSSHKNAAGRRKDIANE